MLKSLRRSLSILLNVSLSMALVITSMSGIFTNFHIEKAFAASSGPNSGGTFVDDATVGTDPWTNLTNAGSSNNSYATVNLNGNKISHYLMATNFGFAVPDGVNILGITVNVERSVNAGETSRDSSVRIVKGGVISGDEKADLVTTYTTTDTVVSYGANNDLWGTTWTSADINAAGFGIAFAASSTSGNRNINVDHISITVEFSADTIDPTVTSVTTAHANGSYTTGEMIDITVGYDELVFVTGTPTLALNSSGSALFNSGSGTDTLTFRYTVAGGENSLDLDYIATNSLTLNGGTIKDAANNDADNTLPAVGTFAGAHAIVIDTIVPTVTIDQAGGQDDPANSSPINFTVVFSEDVIGFDGSDVVLSGTAGATTANVTGGPSTYNVAVSGMTGDGTVIASLNAGAATDAALNPSDASTSTDNTVTFNGSNPNVVISSTAANPTNTSPIPVTVTFDEDVTGFDASDLDILNGSASNFAGGPAVYTFDLTPAGQGTVTVDIAADVAQDVGLNGNTAALQFSRTFDNIAPTVAITSGAVSPTNSTSIPVTITFNEDVSNFVAGDISVGNGSVTNFAGGPAVYTFDLVPAGDGNVTVNVPGGVAEDTATNGNTAATQFSITFDGTSPSVAISSLVSNPTNTSPFSVTVTFDEDVTGFDASDLDIVNGAASNFAGGPAVYTFDLTPAGQGAVTVNIAAGVAQDAATNTNTIATQFTRTFDNVQPNVSLTSTATDPTNSSPIPVTVTFNENVTGFDLGDIVVGNGTPGNLAGGPMVYTFDLTPTANGLTTVNVAAGVAHDSAGNGNTIAGEFSITFDTTLPGVVISSLSGDPLNSAFFTTFTFDENVTGFTLGDINVTNGAAGNFNTVNGMVYTADITPAAPGLVTVGVSAGVAQDAAGNLNTAASNLTRTFDNIQASVNVTTTANDPTNSGALSMTATFSKDITGFDETDLLVGNGTVFGFAGGPSVYTFTVTPGVDGQVTVQVPAGAGQDDALNDNLISNLLSITYDTLAPAVNVEQDGAQLDPTNGSPINFMVTFSENVNGFDETGVTLGGTANPTTAVVTGGPMVYNIAVSGMNGEGTVTAEVIASAATDDAGNGNTASISADNSVFFDNLGPSVLNVSATTADGTYKTGNTISVTVTFSEIVTVTGTPQLTLETGVTDAIVDFTNGSGTDTLTFDYTVAVNEVSPDLDYLSAAALALNGGTIQDALGNNATLTLADPGTAGSLGSNKDLVIDGMSPVLVTWSIDLVNDTLTLTFDEAVDASTLDATGITIQDAATGTTFFALTGGSTTSGNGTTIVIDLVPSDVTSLSAFTTFFITLTSGTIDDLAGNDTVAIADGSAVESGIVSLAAVARSQASIANISSGGSSGSSSTSTSTSTSTGTTSGVLGATTDRSALEDEGSVNGEGSGSDAFTEEIIVYPFRSKSERKEILDRLKGTYGEKFNIRAAVTYGATPGRNGTSKNYLLNTALNVLKTGTKIPTFTVTKTDAIVTIDFSEEVVFLRPVLFVVKNLGESDWKNLTIVDGSGKELNSFGLTEDGTLTIKTNYIRDLTITITDPDAIELLDDTWSDPENEAILRLMQRGVIKGHPDGTFRPKDALKRSETSKLVGLLLGMKSENERASDEWFAPLLRALVSSAIVQGNIPAETIELRANFLALVAKAKGLNINGLTACEIQTFDDVPVDTWYCALVKHAMNEGWIREASGNFEPSGIVTRSWAAGVLDRAF